MRVNDSLYPIAAVLFFIAAIGQLLSVDVLGGQNPPGGVLWIIIALGAAGQWLHLRRRNPETADKMGVMVAILTAAMARTLTS
jgi:hypothetical protein